MTKPISGITQATSNSETDSDYDEARNRLFETLTDDQQALFRFLEHLDKIEADFDPTQPYEVYPHIEWNHGMSSRKLIDRSLALGVIPLFEDSRCPYEPLDWRYIKNRQSETPGKSPQERGAWDTRVYDNRNQGRILLFANSGDFAGMEEDFKEAFDNEPYPIECRDSKGQSYANPAFQKLIQNMPRVTL